MHSETFLELGPMVAAQPIISAHSIGRNVESGEDQADAVEPELAPTLRSKWRSDERARTLRIIPRHGLNPRVASQKIVSGEVRLAPEVDGVREAVAAGREPFVASFAQRHAAVHLDRCPGKVANPDG